MLRSPLQTFILHTTLSPASVKIQLTSNLSRWRGNRQGGENSRQNNQQRQSTNPKDRTVQQDRQNNRSPAMPRSKDMQHGGTKTDKSVKGGPAPTLPTDEHIPVNGFNSKEIKAELRKPNATKSLTYRLPKQESTTSRPASTPWGAKRLSPYAQNNYISS